MKSLVNYAVQYAEKGFSVIPTIDKKPLIKFADKKPLTPDEIRNFWKTHPYANIALKTEQFFVVDVDRHSDGDDGTQAIKNLNHPEWFKTLCQKTAHNGFQFFFKKPKERITQNIGFLPGVDIKAHPNNYVVVAPSEIDEKRYQWVNHLPMVEPTEELIQLIEEKGKPTISEKKIERYHPKGKTQTSELFSQIANGLGPTGGRNNALASFAGGLLFRNVDPEVVLELARIANSRTEYSLTDNEVVTTVNSMIKKEIRRRGETVE
ncbi:DNA primase [Limosilactobacillus reuteri]|uniref:bifunctional DNA primase/polymerase n=1 Tax=Limosilactobacillus reuteri TaxID=1598 RepID=UPI000B99A49C|nr:bifunctional DNA primase/polymerase [Limosilactobacillus reuteri]OYS79022.1 DNA primase [Limosilactobacillus reuteri]OYS82728.1 DNA primase [Limosilactobacillus reuteri]OYS84375.1 DNA primase [Limosilactobacillus reuteri]